MITWLASYPRSGNTLTRMILHKRFGQETYSLHGDRFDIGANTEMSRLTGHVSNRLISRSRLQLMRQSARTYFVKTHRPPDSNAAEDDRVIYILRDGRDVVCSYFNYLVNFASRYVSLADVVLGQVPFGLWAEHVRDWQAMQNDNMLFLRYEDFLHNQDDFIKAIAEFTALPDSGLALPGFESLNRMNREFFRRGASAGWQQDLGEDMLRLFWAVHGDVMRSVGYHPEMDDPPTLGMQGATTLRRHLDLTRGLSGVREVNSELQHEATRLADELRAANRELQSVRTELHAMRESTSWRITAPVRWLVGCWRSPSQPAAVVDDSA